MTIFEKRLGNMKQTEDSSQRVHLVGLFDKILNALDAEINSLPDTLQAVSPEKRLDFISKTLPLLLKFRESWEESSWIPSWGD